MMGRMGIGDIINYKGENAFVRSGYLKPRYSCRRGVVGPPEHPGESASRSNLESSTRHAARVPPCTAVSYRSSRFRTWSGSVPWAA